jgi:hypothetical protein
MSPRGMEKCRRLTPSLAYGKVFEEAKRQKEMTKAAKGSINSEPLARPRAGAEPSRYVNGATPRSRHRLISRRQMVQRRRSNTSHISAVHNSSTRMLDSRDSE